MILRSLPAVGHPLPIGATARVLCKTRWETSTFPSRFWPGRRTLTLSSGSAALVLALQTLRRSLPERREVVLPAYTCPSVLAAVVKVGLRPILCDLRPGFPGMDEGQLDACVTRRTLAVVAVHLFGLAERVDLMGTIARAKGAFLLEDAAQAFGNRLPTCSTRAPACRQTGDSGDLAVFSFGRGKPLSLLAGGCVVVNNPDLVSAADESFRQWPPGSRGRFRLFYGLKLAAYGLAFHPRLFWLPASLPWLMIGETVFSLEIAQFPMDPMAMAMGEAIAPGFESIQQVRREVVRQYVETLSPYRNRFAFFPAPDEGQVLLRFPLAFHEGKTRDRVLEDLKAMGLGATGSYPCPLHRQPGTAPYLDAGGSFPRAEQLAETILTLPVHTYVRKGDIETMRTVIGRHLG